MAILSESNCPAESPLCSCRRAPPLALGTPHHREAGR